MLVLLAIVLNSHNRACSRGNRTEGLNGVHWGIKLSIVLFVILLLPRTTQNFRNGTNNSLCCCHCCLFFCRRHLHPYSHGAFGASSGFRRCSGVASAAGQSANRCSRMRCPVCAAPSSFAMLVVAAASCRLPASSANGAVKTARSVFR